MACVDYTTWNNAKVACQNLQQSVRGLGHNYAPTGLRAMRGLGFSVSASVSPSAFTSLVQGVNQSSAAAPAPSSSPTLNTASASSATDPCAIAAQTPCPAKPKALTAAPPPIVCGSGFFKTCNPAPCHCAPVAPGPTDTTVMMPTTQASTSTGGFSQWGLLAVLAVGGFVVYKVATHKKASS